MKHSDQITEVAASLIKAKTNFVPAKKSGFNKHLNSNYSNLDDVLAAITPALNDNGLIVIQSTLDTSTERLMYIQTLIMHSSGQWIAFDYQMPIEGIKAQQYGSTTSYGRRYALCAALGIAQTDDDAEIAKRTASDFKKLIESCEDVDTLQIIHKNAKQVLAAADWKVVEEYFLKKKAALSGSTARGFNPARKQDEPKKQEPVAKPDDKTVQSESIENF